ncbi:CDP-glucose 4,6-dehydratase [Kaistia sp. 32K]|uniref:CDP-glucose 4,6-dehydratase n=1 Tax=Kaistia sp. 32K TaxID=2795690 RepID=UPI001915A0A1|nr:CDP-glucose 4,6-dehydratase [Kaistia sp. 32K]BCP53929.1 CDP-glucose 4,6-dehydratase [Kaistia sp. 32K]
MADQRLDERYLSEVLRGRRILVTGHTGFKGGWLSLWLRRLGATVVGVALPPTAPSFCKAVGLEALVDGRVGDIRSQSIFGRSIEGEDFDLVIHMAAQAFVRTSFEAPVDTYLTNVVGTAIVLDAARHMPSLRGVVVVTSDKCYENREWVWGYRENDPMGGRDPYSSSKGCAELVAAAFRASYFNDPNGPQLSTVRAGNVIGGGDWGADRLIPDLVRSVETDMPVRLRNPKSVRPWQHVLEPVRGYLLLAARLLETGARYAGGWNFGPDTRSTVEVGTLADMVIAKWQGKRPRYVVERRDNEAPESAVLRLDSTKSSVDLGWSPLLRLEETVAMTVAWYQSYRQDPAGIRAFSQHQIDEYAAAWGRGD